MRGSWIDRMTRLASSESECEHLDTRFEELDFEGSIGDWLRLSNQLMQALFDDHAVTAAVHVDTARSARWAPVERHSETYNSVFARWSHDQMKVAGVKAMQELPLGAPVAVDWLPMVHSPARAHRFSPRRPGAA